MRRVAGVVVVGLLAACGGGGSPTVASPLTSTTTTTTVGTETTVPTTTTTASPAAPTLASVATTTAPSPPPEDGDVAPVSAETLGTSWREGCPVGPDQLRMLTVSYFGFDGAVHQGNLVVNVSAVSSVRAAFAQMLTAQFPIRKVVPVDVYGASDDASMADDNTSAFNCRAAAGSSSWSVHAYGLAIDVNPVENPYVHPQLGVLPPNGAAYVDRSNVRPGMAVPGSALTDAFAAIGWGWGGAWANPDYQHFSATGR
jgi:hypothetical protein